MAFGKREQPNSEKPTQQASRSLLNPALVAVGALGLAVLWFSVSKPAAPPSPITTSEEPAASAALALTNSGPRPPESGKPVVDPKATAGPAEKTTNSRGQPDREVIPWSDGTETVTDHEYDSYGRLSRSTTTNRDGTSSWTDYSYQN